MDPDPWKLWAGFLEGDEGSGKAKEVVQTQKVSREEEQKEYEVEEELSEVQKIKLFFEKRRPLQVRCGLEMMRRQLQTDSEEVEVEILPCLRELLADNTLGDLSSLHRLAAEVVTEAAEEGRLRKEGVRTHIFPIAMTMLSSSNTKVAKKWMKAMIAILPLAEESDVEKKLLPFALENGEVSKSADQRLLCASLVGALARSLSVDAINGTPVTATSKSAQSLFKRAMALCQDTDHNVRGRLAQQLAALAQAFNARPGTETKIRHDGIVDEVLELLKDEEAEVREQAVEGVIPLLEQLPGSMQATVTAALTHEVYGKARSRPEDLPMLSRHIGPLAVQVWKGLPEGDLSVYAEFLAGAPAFGESEARANIAYNLPGLLLALGKEQYEAVLGPLVEGLAKDGEPAVREATARALEGLVGQLDPAVATKHLQRVMVGLLKDEQRGVRDAVVGKLPALLPVLLPGEGEGGEEVVQSLMKALGGMQGQHSFWRQELALVEAIGAAGEAFSPTQVQEAVLPALLRSLAGAAPQVSLAAGQALLALLRLSRNPQLRADSCQRLAREYGRASSFGKRMLFCEVCLLVPRFFSRHFFKVFFIDTALEVIKDDVPNVRCRACRLLPLIKRSLKLPFDASLLETVINNMIRLLKDPDPDVVAAARAVSDQVYKMDELKPAAADPEDDAKRADEEQVHGALERKPLHMHRPPAEAGEGGGAKAGGAGWASGKGPGAAGKYSSLGGHGGGNVPKLSGVPKAGSMGDAGRGNLSPTGRGAGAGRGAAGRGAAAAAAGKAGAGSIGRTLSGEGSRPAAAAKAGGLGGAGRAGTSSLKASAPVAARAAAPKPKPK